MRSFIFINIKYEYNITLKHTHTHISNTFMFGRIHLFKKRMHVRSSNTNKMYMT